MQRLIRRILACAVVAVLGLPLVLVVLGVLRRFWEILATSLEPEPVENCRLFLE